MFALGNVPADALELDHPALLIEDASFRPLLPAHPAVRQNDSVFYRPNRIARGDRRKELIYLRRIIRMYKRLEGTADQLLKLAAEIAAVGLVDKSISAVGENPAD